jgi:hypothetical protein
LYGVWFALGGGNMAKKDDLELRPVMTRIPEGLRRRLEREARWLRRSMNAEIVHRLQQSFDIPDQIQSVVDAISSEVDLSDVEYSLDEIQSQVRAILSHLGLPDPAEDRQRVREEARALGEARRRKDQERRAAMERAKAEKAAEQAIPPFQTKPPDAGPPAETKDEESK